ncbi:hypothetical protein HDU98_006296 [Podochytrium sp. JEL0797]|nr:hypothetical protein HDU98_006296 [Podochytrium sp. JEL0797]
MTVVTKQKLDEVVAIFPVAKKLIDDFAANEPLWWEQQKYVETEERFGADFVNDIARKGIKKLECFSEAPEAFVDTLAMTMKCLVFQPNENIISISDVADCMYFILQGSVEVMAARESSTRNADVIGEFGEILESVSGPTAYFGEVAIIEHVPRTASVKCTKTCSTYELRKDDVNHILKSYPEIEKKMKETASLRMQQYLMRSVLA